MTHDERIAKQTALLVEGMGLRGLAEELVTAQAQLVLLLDTYKLWSPEGTFTFPDGSTAYRENWERF